MSIRKSGHNHVVSPHSGFDLPNEKVAGLAFGATFFNSAQETLDEHAQLSFSRGARIIPARLGGRGPLIGAGAVGVRGLRRAGRNRG